MSSFQDAVDLLHKTASREWNRLTAYSGNIQKRLAALHNPGNAHRSKSFAHRLAVRTILPKDVANPAIFHKAWILCLAEAS